MSINQVPGMRTDIAEMLSKIREVSNKSSVFGNVNVNSVMSGSSASATSATSGTNSFNDILSVAKGALNNVTQLQAQSEQIKNSYITGDGSVSMSQVVVAAQKSKLAFEGLVTVRNKILEAYKEIMSMPV